MDFIGNNEDRELFKLEKYLSTFKKNKDLVD